MAARNPRVQVNFRMGVAGRDRIDAIAVETGVDRSEVIRACLALALSRPAEVKERVQRAKEQQ